MAWCCNVSEACARASARAGSLVLTAPGGAEAAFSDRFFGARAACVAQPHPAANRDHGRVQADKTLWNAAQSNARHDRFSRHFPWQCPDRLGTLVALEVPSASQSQLRESFHAPNCRTLPDCGALACLSCISRRRPLVRPFQPGFSRAPSSRGSPSRRRSSLPATGAYSSPRRAASSRCSTICRIRRRTSLPICARKCTTSGIAGCSASSSIPISRQRTYVYVLYALDAPIGGTAPTMGRCRCDDGSVPDSARTYTDGCVIGARLSRLTESGNGGDTDPRRFFLRIGASSIPAIRLGRLPSGAMGRCMSRAEMAPVSTSSITGRMARRSTRAVIHRPASEARKRHRRQRVALSAVRTSRRVSDPTGFNGSVLRLDPLTGQALPDNPLYRRCVGRRRPYHRIRAAQPVQDDRSSWHQRSVGG